MGYFAAHAARPPLQKKTYTPCVFVIYHRGFLCVACMCVLFAHGVGVFVCPRHSWQCASWSIVNITYSKAYLILSRLSLFFISRSAGVLAGRSSQRTSGSGAAVPDSYCFVAAYLKVRRSAPCGHAGNSLAVAGLPTNALAGCGWVGLPWTMLLRCGCSWPSLA